MSQPVNNTTIHRESRQGGWRRWRLVCLIQFFCWLWLFWPMLAGSTSVGFRDAANWYFPMLRWITERQLEGDWPRFSSTDIYGHDLVADGSSAMFYPFKIILLASFADFVIRWNWFLALHVLGAMFAVTWISRGVLKMSEFAAGLAGLSYGLAGPVVFQITNPLYLCGAAWLPLSFGFILQALQSQAWNRWKWSVPMASVSTAMMILAGDLQMAALIFTGLFAYATWRVLADSMAGILRSRGTAGSLPAPQAIAIWMGVVCGALILSMVQWIPMVNAVVNSERVPQSSTSYLWQAVPAVLTGQIEAAGKSLANSIRLDANSHSSDIYQFSQTPWSVVELVLPGMSGTPWPVNTRWVDELPGSDRMWQPSLFQGTSVVLMTIMVVISGRGLARRFFIAGAFFTVLSFGWYGPAWLVNEIAFAFGADQVVLKAAPPSGGGYWLLVQFIPGWSMFRYPAKLCVPAALAFSIAGGYSFDWLMDSTRSKSCMIRSRMIAVILTGASFSIFLASLWIDVSQLLAIRRGIDVDHYFGPLDYRLASQNIQMSCLVFFATSTSLAILLTLKRDRPLLFLHGVMVILALELTVSQSRLIPMVDSDCLVRSDSPVDRDTLLSRQQCGYRLISNVPLSMPPEWSRSGSSKRMEELIRWNRIQLLHRWNWDQNIATLESSSSLQRQPELLPKAYRESMEIAMEPLENSIDAVNDPDINRFFWIPRILPLYGGSSGIFSSIWIENCRERIVWFINAKSRMDLWFPEGRTSGWSAVIYPEGKKNSVRLPECEIMNVPSGRSVIVLEYKPHSRRLLWVSNLLAWSLLIVWLVIGAIQSRRYEACVIIGDRERLIQDQNVLTDN